MSKNMVILNDALFSYLPKTKFSICKGQINLCTVYGLQKIPEAWNKIT